MRVGTSNCELPCAKKVDNLLEKGRCRTERISAKEKRRESTAGTVREGAKMWTRSGTEASMQGDAEAHS